MSVLKFQSEIVKIMQLSPTVKSFDLSVPPEFTFEPGQFVTIIVAHHDGKKERRSYSIASVKGNAIEICINKVENGRISPLFHDFKIGQKLTIQGPLGVFVLKKEADEKDNVFIATGTGITPFVPMITALLEKTKKKVILLAGYKHEDEVLYDDIFRGLQSGYRNFEYHVIISRPKNPVYRGDKGRVQFLIEKYVSHKFLGDFYLCGLFEMIKDVGQLLVQKGTTKERIIFERYD
jgi:ferredoxin-NADP reductase